VEYHNEEDVYSPKKRRLLRRRITYAVMLAVAILALSAFVAWGQQLKMGDQIEMNSAFCANEDDGRALLEAVQGGTDSGMEYMSKEDNTCALSQMPVVIGEVVEIKGIWVLIKVLTPYGEIYSVSQKKFFILTET